MKFMIITTIAVTIAILMPHAAGATDLISVDLESSYTGQGAPFSGIDPFAAAADPLFNAANVWNVLGSTGFNVANPSFPNLMDSSGVPAGVDFNIIGNISAHGAGDPADALVTDYFYWNIPNANSSSLEWELTGLDPSSAYVYFANSSDYGASRSFNMLVDTDGDGDLADEVSTLVVHPTGALWGYVVPQPDGRIIGRADAISGEANWTCFQLFRASQVVATESETWGGVKALYWR